MSDVMKPEGGAPPGFQLPHFPKNWGPYLGYNAAIAFFAIGMTSVAHSEIGAVVIGCVAICAVVAGLIVQLRK
jgi:hypothetical protein